MQNKREEEIRKNIADRLRAFEEAGHNPYPAVSNRTHLAKEAKELGEGYKEAITLTGRLVALRNMGKSAFGRLQDRSGELQVFFAKDELDKAYALAKKLDRGDFIQATGTLFTTKTGELTLHITEFQLLSKIRNQLPEKWHGLKDPEERQRRRYLDLLSNQETRELFKQRSEFIKNIRQFLDESEFLEVTTPILQPLYGGALAEPFTTHHNALDLDLYLRIAPELYLKRLVVGGYERVYEIAASFRNEGVSPQHLQEFYMLEFYMAYADYNQLMDFTEKFIKTTLETTFGTLQFENDGETLDFSSSWPRLDYGELVKKDTGIDVFAHKNKDELLAEIKEKGLKVDAPKDAGHAKLIDELYKTYSRPHITQPAFLINHPTILSPLSKQSAEDPAKVERFQLLVKGYEVVNGFSELNDPVEQKSRFEDQGRDRDAGDKEAHEMDHDYIEALEYGMPPTAGLGMGIERIFALVTNQSTLRDVVLFPTFRPKNNHNQAKSKSEDKKEKK